MDGIVPEGIIDGSNQNLLKMLYSYWHYLLHDDPVDHEIHPVEIAKRIVDND